MELITSLLTSLGLAAWIPVVLGIVGLASAISTIYPTTWLGASWVHKLALLVGNAKPLITVGSVPTTTPPIPPGAKSILAILVISGVLIGLVACAPKISDTTDASTPNILNTVYKNGQLFCAAKNSLLAIVDATTGGAFTVTNKTSELVTAVCDVLGGTPANEPSNPLFVPAVTIIPPLVKVT